jgi:hypothetical protein
VLPAVSLIALAAWFNGIIADGLPKLEFKGCDTESRQVVAFMYEKSMY